MADVKTKLLNAFEVLKKEGKKIVTVHQPRLD